MQEISFEYWQQLAEQTILISSLLGGFSIAVIANLLVAQLEKKISKNIMVVSTLAACSFLICLFSMTKLRLMTTEGYPIEVLQEDLNQPRIIGSIFFFLGIFWLITMIALSGWTQSKRLGIFTTAIGILTLLAIIIMVT